MTRWKRAIIGIGALLVTAMSLPLAANPNMTMVTDETLLYVNRLNGASGGGIVNSNDASVLAFRTYAGNLFEGVSGVNAPLVVKDLQSGEVVPVTYGPNIGRYALSGEGRYLAYTDDNTLWLLDRTTGERQEIATSAPDSHVSVSAGAAHVVFESEQIQSLNPALPPSNLRQVVQWTQASGEFSLISASSDGSAGDGASSGPMITLLGDAVAYVSAATNLVADDNNQVVDAFVSTVGQGSQLISRTESQQVESDVAEVFIAPGGRYAAFVSDTRVLLPESDRTRAPHAYAVNLDTGELQLASTDEDGSPYNTTGVARPWISSDGQTILFFSFSTTYYNFGIPGELIKTKAFGPGLIEKINQRPDQLFDEFGRYFSTDQHGSLIVFSGNILNRMWFCDGSRFSPSCTTSFQEIYSQEGVSPAPTTALSTSFGLPKTALAREYLEGMNVSADGRYVGGRWRLPQRVTPQAVHLDRDAEAFSTFGESVPRLSSDGRYFVRTPLAVSITRAEFFLWWTDTLNLPGIVTPAELAVQGVFGKLVLTTMGSKAYFASIAFLNPGEDGVGQINQYNADTETVELVDLGMAETPEDVSAEVVNISADGDFLIFKSPQDAPGVDAGGIEQLYLRNFPNRETTLLSADAAGNPSSVPVTVGDISDDGQIVVIQTHEPDFLVDGAVGPVPQRIYRLNRTSNERRWLSPDLQEDCVNPNLSNDGRYTSFDCAGTLYLFDQQKDRTTIVLESDESASGFTVENHQIPGNTHLFVDLRVRPLAPFVGLPGDPEDTLQVVEIALDDPFFDTVYKNGFE